MATKHGSIGEFDAGSEDWESYAKRLEQYFVGNDVTAPEKKRALLLSTCGATTYMLIRNLVAPEKPTSRSFRELVELVQQHYQLKPSVMVEQFKFHTCQRQQGEWITTFVARLRKLTQHCEFGGGLKEMLRDRLVCGIGEARLQRRLLAESSLKFEKPLALAVAWESAEQNAKDLQSAAESETAAVHSLINSQRSTEKVSPLWKVECYQCGGKHGANSCRFRDTECFACGEKGHLARMCSRRREGDRANRNTQANWVTGLEDELPGEYSMF